MQELLDAINDAISCDYVKVLMHFVWLMIGKKKLEKGKEEAEEATLVAKLLPSPFALRSSPFAFAFVTDGNHFFFILVIFIPFFSFLFFFESVRISLFTFKLQQTWATASSSLFFSSKPSNSIDALLAMLWTYVVFFWNEKATKHGTLGALVQDSVKSHYETLFYCFPFPSPAPILCFPGSPFISFDFISV
nr:uncharacterized protein LOC112763292 [Arachis hypogaea]